MPRLRLILAAFILTAGLGTAVAAPAPASAAVVYTFGCGNHNVWGDIASNSSTNATSARTGCFNKLNDMQSCIDYVSFWYQSGGTYWYKGFHYSDKWWCGTGYHTLSGAYQ